MIYNMTIFSASSNSKDIKSVYSSRALKMCPNGSLVCSHTFTSLVCHSRGSLKR